MFIVELQSLIYNLAKNILITTYGFPNELENIQFDPSFAIRGLTVDLKHGVICKLSHANKVGQSFVFYGKNQLSPKEIENLYGFSRHIPQSVNYIHIIRIFTSL